MDKKSSVMDQKKGSVIDQKGYFSLSAGQWSDVMGARQPLDAIFSFCVVPPILQKSAFFRVFAPFPRACKRSANSAYIEGLHNRDTEREENGVWGQEFGTSGGAWQRRS